MGSSGCIEHLSVMDFLFEHILMLWPFETHSYACFHIISIFVCGFFGCIMWVTSHRERAFSIYRISLVIVCWII
jgi:hypothetical protein